jgi:hypothetical protein
MNCLVQLSQSKGTCHLSGYAYGLNQQHFCYPDRRPILPVITDDCPVFTRRNALLTLRKSACPLRCGRWVASARRASDTGAHMRSRHGCVESCFWTLCRTPTPHCGTQGNGSCLPEATLKDADRASWASQNGHRVGAPLTTGQMTHTNGKNVLGPKPL